DEAVENMPILPARAYIAPGGFHLILKKSQNGAVVAHIDEGPPENFCRPSVNPMLRSLIPIYGSAVVAVILTGMGSDGSQVCADLVKQGGHVLAQDEASSTVWGMPGTVAQAGLCSAVLPPAELADAVRRMLKGGTP